MKQVCSTNLIRTSPVNQNGLFVCVPGSLLSRFAGQLDQSTGLPGCGKPVAGAGKTRANRLEIGAEIVQNPDSGKTPERWLSGRKHVFAKDAYGSNCTAGSNPVLSALVLALRRPFFV